MGQEDEEAAELVATIRGEHVAMKTWYSGSSAAAETLQQKYGPYPSLWKEVLNWPGWKEARKAYLQFIQIGEAATPIKTEDTSSSAPRKRRSRWGTAPETDQPVGNDVGTGAESGSSNKRRSRWGKEDSEQPTAGIPTSQIATPAPQPQQQHWQQQQVPQLQPLPGLPGLVLPGMPSHLNPQQQAEFQRLQSRLRDVNDKLSGLDMEAARVDALPRGHPERSPSPPPIYDVDGKRKNTRAVRWRERYNEERHDILERLMSLNPATRQSSLFKRKRSKKIRIPIEEHPNYNFIGLIIGPRGKTQKELEAKTGCKIAIRGKGSVKEGARGRRDGKMMEGDDEPLHVVITGDDQKSVDAAADMIEQMLVVIDDEKNVHKQQQLRELALLNGTLKEDEYCQICAEKGHRSFECPRRFAMSKQQITVKCAICGDTSHPTRDCTQKPAIDKPNQQELDSDYMSFMAELDGKKSAISTPSAPPVSGVTILKPAVPVGSAATDTAAAPSTGITILKPATKICLPVNTDSNAGGDTTQPPTGEDITATSSSSSVPVAPPPPPMSLLPPGLPPQLGLPPPPLPSSTLPPPPVMASPNSSYAAQTSIPGNNYYGNHAGYGNYPPGNASQGYGQPYHRDQQQHYQQSQRFQYNSHSAQPQQQRQGQPQQQHQQQQQQAGGDQTSGWDYQAYYGQGGASGGTGGAGGFNWWEQ